MKLVPIGNSRSAKRPFASYAIWTLVSAFGVFLTVFLIVAYVPGKYLAVTGAAASAVAAIATAAAAIAAFLAARDSSTAARDSVRAISYATKPMLDAYVDSTGDSQATGVAHVRVENVSMYAAASGRIEWDLRGGRKGTGTFTEIEGRTLPYTGRIAGRPGPSANFPVPFLGDDVAGVERLTVTYSGRTGTTQWQLINVSEWRSGVQTSRYVVEHEVVNG